MIVKTQKPLMLKNNCGAIYKEWQLEQAILWYSQTKPVCRVKTIFLHGRYPAVSIQGPKIHIHRLLMSWHLKRRLKSSENVHHVNENKMDSRLSNLRVIPAGQHQAEHLKGKPQEAEFVRRRIAASVKKRWPHETPTSF